MNRYQKKMRSLRIIAVLLCILLCVPGCSKNTSGDDTSSQHAAGQSGKSDNQGKSGQSDNLGKDNQDDTHGQDNQEGKTDSQGQENQTGSHEQNSQISRIDEIENEALKEARETVAGMTLEKKIGQMIMPAFRSWTNEDGTSNSVRELNSEMKEAIRNCGFGGIILFSENFESTEQTVRLIQDMQATALEGGNLPLLIGVDQEGGRVARINMGTTMTGNMALGAIGSTDITAGKQAADETGHIIGSELKALGINVNFAPDMDVNNNPQNPVIGLRSFSDDPELVAGLGVSMMKGLQSENIATALKHFPGHGDTTTDSHIGLPVINKSEEELEECEWIPFRAGIKEGTDIVMTAHIEFPQIETEIYKSPLTGNEIHLPATLSKTLLTDILRGKMGFEGVVVTDAMNMNALADNFPVEEAVKYAINAGVDILLMPVDASTKEGLGKLQQLTAVIKGLVSTGDISEKQITAAAERITALKVKRGILDTKQYDKAGLDERVRAAELIVGSQEHHDRERALAGQAVTVIYDDETLPLKPKSDEKILVLCPYEDEMNAFIYGINRLRKEGIIDDGVVCDAMVYMNSTNPAATAAQTNQDMAETHTAGTKTLEESIEAVIRQTDYILLDSNISSIDQLNPADSRAGWRSAAVDMIIRAANKYQKTVILVSTGLPYDSARYSGVNAHCLCYLPRGINGLNELGEPAGIYGAGISASVDAIFGKVEAIGSLPVNVMKLDNQYKMQDEVLFKRGSNAYDMTVNNLTSRLNMRRKNAAEEPLEKSVYDYGIVGKGEAGDFTEDEVAELVKYHTYKNKITLEEALEDLDMLMRLFKTSYGGYTYFGGDKKFDEAKLNITQRLKETYTGKSDLTGYFQSILLEELSFIKDGHLRISSENTSFKKMDIYYDSSQREFIQNNCGFYITINGVNYYLSSDDEAYIDETVNDSGKLVWGLFASAEEADALPSKLMLNNLTGNETTIDITWVLTESGGAEVNESNGYSEKDGVKIISLKTMDLIQTDEANNFINAAKLLKDEDVFILDLRGNHGGMIEEVNFFMHNLTGALCEYDRQSVKRFSPLNLYHQSVQFKELGWEDGFKGYKNIDFYNENKSVVDSWYSSTIGQNKKSGDTIVDSYQSEWKDYKNTIIVLVDRNVVSAGEFFLYELETVGNVIIMGTNTCGCLVTGDVNIHSTVYLPNTGISVVYGQVLNMTDKIDDFDVTGWIPDVITVENGTKDALALAKEIKEVR